MTPSNQRSISRQSRSDSISARAQAGVLCSQTSTWPRVSSPLCRANRAIASPRRNHQRPRSGSKAFQFQSNSGVIQSQSSSTARRSRCRSSSLSHRTAIPNRRPPAAAAKASRDRVSARAGTSVIPGSITAAASTARLSGRHITHPHPGVVPNRR